MADIYVDSNAVGANTGADWTNAYTTLALAAAVDVAGDTIYVAHNHNESIGATTTWAFATNNSVPSKLICANTGATPPTTVATTANIATTTSFSGTMQGGLYVYGLNISVGSGSNSVTLALNPNDAGASPFYESCSFTLAGSGVSSGMIIGVSNSATALNANFKNCAFIYSRTISGYVPITIVSVNCSIIGGSISCSGSSSGSNLFNLLAASGEGSHLRVRDCDFTNNASNMKLIATNSTGTTCLAIATFINCKLPAAWSGSPLSSALLHPNVRVSMYNCDSGATNYNLWIETFSGHIKSEIAIIRNYGATNGITPISWKLVTNANANEYVAPLITDDMAVWVDSIGSVKKITVDILHDSATALTDAEIWLEIDYLGSSATPLGTPLSDKRVTVLTTAANQPTSTASWTTTGLTTPNKQKLEVTFTPQMKGFVYARVCLAKPSYTVYVDPQAILS